MADKWILALGASKAYADSLLKGFIDVQPKPDGTGLIFTTKDSSTFEVTLPYHTHGNLSDVLEKLSINADGKLEFDGEIITPSQYIKKITKSDSTLTVTNSDDTTTDFDISNGVSNYNDLSSKPTLNGIEITGDRLDYNYNLANIDHNHDDKYANIDHNHNVDYASIDHNHDSLYSNVDHNHNEEYATKSSEHIHANQETTLDKLSVIDGELAYNNIKIKQDLTNYATHDYVDSQTSRIYKYIGVVELYNDLPTDLSNESQDIGKCYKVKNGNTYCWNGTGWDNLGGDVDLSLYATTSYVDTLNNTTMSNISTVLLDYTTNADLASALSDYAKENDLARVSFTGKYEDLEDLPTIPEITNVAVLNKFSEVDGKPYYNGNQLGQSVGGGVSDYNELNGLPILNGEEVKGEHAGAFYGLMDKEIYASETNEGNVKSSDVAKKLEYLADNSDPFTYAGHNMEGIEGVYPFPIGTPDESKIQKREFNDVTIGWEKVIESLVPLDDKVIVSVLKLVEQENDIDATLKSFNAETELSFNHTEYVDINDSVSIKSTYEIPPILNDDGVYEYDISQFTFIGGVK